MGMRTETQTKGSVGTGMGRGRKRRTTGTAMDTARHTRKTSARIQGMAKMRRTTGMGTARHTKRRLATGMGTARRPRKKSARIQGMGTARRTRKKSARIQGMDMGTARLTTVEKYRTRNTGTGMHLTNTGKGMFVLVSSCFDGLNHLVYTCAPCFTTPNPTRHAWLECTPGRCTPATCNVTVLFYVHICSSKSSLESIPMEPWDKVSESQPHIVSCLIFSRPRKQADATTKLHQCLCL